MKKALRISCILLLTVLILTANTVFSSAVHEKEAVDLREALTVADEKHGAYASRLTDGMYNTRVSYADGEKVSVSCGTEIGCAFIAWQSMPSKVSIAWTDKEGKTIANEEWTPARLDDYIDVSQPGVCGYTLTFQKACSVSELGAYTAGELSDDLPRFEAPLKKPAVMLITGYPGDELACFGGLLPSLINMGVPVQVVYINPYNRNRQEECLRTLWKLGMRNEPIFLDTAGIRSLDSTVLKSTLEKNGEVSKKLLNVLESCCPSVIVTHGKNRQFPLMSESEAAYKVVTGDYVYKKIKNQSWLKKIYLVAEKGDSKGQKFDFSDGYDQAAALLKEGYVSMRTFHYTPYGDDTYILHFANGSGYKEGNMLTNISYTSLKTPEPAAEPTAEPEESPTATPTAEPTVESTAEPTPEPTEEPTPTPTAVPTQAPAVARMTEAPSTPVPTPMPRLADTKTVMTPIVLSLIVAAILFTAMVVLKRVMNVRLPVIVGILVPVFAGLVIFFGMYRAASLNERQAAAAEHFDGMIAIEAAAARTEAPTFTPEPTLEPTAAPTAEPTPVLTPKPTATPTAVPTIAPTATPDPDIGVYTDGAEVVEKDPDNGKWIYKNETLSIEITRYTGKTDKVEYPYYVADIHMRADEFRAGFGHEKRSGTDKDSAMGIAKRYRAVLMITGDNIIHMDKDKKGVLIRDGWVYQDTKKGDLMIWHPETLSIELVAKNNISSAQLIREGGVENCISFGPILIQDGVKTSKKTLESNKVIYNTNPRVGVGMVKPGHFIVIVGGYRSDALHKSLGWTLAQFADLMESYGCVQAYNMDGGVSACMVFMGERLNKGGNKKDWSQLRTLPDGLLFGYSDKVAK